MYQNWKGNFLNNIFKAVEVTVESQRRKSKHLCALMQFKVQ